MKENSNQIKKEEEHSLVLTNRKQLTVTAIKEVMSATDKTIIAKTTQNNINIVGSELRVSKLVLEEGLLMVEGNIDLIKYQQETGKGFFRRLFK